MRSLYNLSATALRDLFLKGEVTAIEIATHFLKRIEKHNEALGAFLQVLEAKALLKAEELDRKRACNQRLGKLAAVPIAIKDNIHIAGEITSCSSNYLRKFRAPFSATAVRLLEEEDALLIGKVNLDEFAMGSANENSAFFPANNPWNVRYVPGGSSGGSASAVAARLSPIALGSDTGGSIRQPAAFTGIVGFKPTYGRVSRFGLVAFGSSLDQVGPMTSCVADAALTMEVIGRPCPCDATSLDLPPETYLLSRDLKEVKIGVPWHFLEDLKPEIKENFSASLEICQTLGAEVVDIDLDILKYSVATYYILSTAEASTNLARFDGIRYGASSANAKTLEEVYTLSRREGFGREVKKRILLGTYVLSSGYRDAYYKRAQKVRTRIIDAFEAAFEACDVIATPVAPSAAFMAGSIRDPVELYLQDIFTVPANLAGLPAISLPSGYNGEGLPLALQLIGPQMCDTSVMRYAYAYEQASQQVRIPPSFADEAP